MTFYGEWLAETCKLKGEVGGYSRNPDEKQRLHDESQDDGKKLMGSGYILMRELAGFPKDRTEHERDFLVFDLINFVSSGTIYRDKKNWQNRFQELWQGI